MATRYDDKIEKIEKIENSDPLKSIEAPEEIERLPPNKERFDSLMVIEDPKKLELSPSKVEAKVELDPTSKRNSLFDHAREINSSKTDNLKVEPSELIAQTEKAINKINEIKTQLQQPGAQLKDSATPIMRKKLEHIDENINVVLSKSGSEFTPSTPTPPTGPLTTSSNPILRFLGMLTDGQAKLQTLSNDVERWHLNKVEIAPATMLSMQIKVNYITQELEFFSSLLNKALESTKTIMNVQV